MTLRHAIDATRETNGRCRHVKLLVARIGMESEAQKRFLVDAHLFPYRANAFQHFAVRKHVVACRYRRVRREDAAIAHLRDRFFKRQARSAQFTNTFNHHECSVSFVGVPRFGMNAHRAQHAHSTNAKQPLLTQSQRRTASIQLRQHVRTTARCRAPSMPGTGVNGTVPRSNCAPESSCQPSTRTRWSKYPLR